MEEQLITIEYLLWTMIALFIFVILTNVICYIVKSGEKRNDDKIFRLLWDKDELDKLIDESEAYLKNYPNNQNALFFGAKALIVRKEYTRAKSRLNTLLEIEPTLRETLEEMLDEIHNIENS